MFTTLTNLFFKVLLAVAVSALALYELVLALNILSDPGDLVDTLNSYLSMQLAPSDYQSRAVDLPLVTKALTVVAIGFHLSVSALLASSVVIRLGRHEQLAEHLLRLSLLYGATYYLATAVGATYFRVALFNLTDTLILYLAVWVFCQMSNNLKAGNSDD